MYMGVSAYKEAPPLVDFVDPQGAIVISADEIIEGQMVFQQHALMDYGSMFGDGASRGPDYTAFALHRVSEAMSEFHRKETPTISSSIAPDLAAYAVERKVQSEIKENNFDPFRQNIRLVPAQVFAWSSLESEVERLFTTDGAESMHPVSYIHRKSELRRLAAFFFWGAWVCGAQRPGHQHSYTHNWPFDKAAGNTPTSEVLLWSVLGALALVAGVGACLYMRGRIDKSFHNTTSDTVEHLLTVESLKSENVTDLQRSTFKFIVTAACLFLLQVLCGALVAHDFVGLTNWFGRDISPYLPITVVRGWHLQLSLLWISACWIGASIFVLPKITNEQPRGQLALTNTLYALLVVIVLADLIGTYLGAMSKLGANWNLLGNQGWEFVELGRLWQGFLFVAFGLWSWIMYRGIQPFMRGKEPLALPNWLFYSVVSILVLFCAGFVATPRTNFVIADFWRWCVIHMWVEAFFEVFTTALVSYFMYLMGLVSKRAAVSVVYLSTLLFLGSGILGISHNFYWNAKPVATLAIGSVFSTLQVVPLILLTLEAWNLRQMPGESLRTRAPGAIFAHNEAFLFLLGVNFWNFVGAGVFGFIINLPIVNYYEHGTYLTVNHGHAALMGVYGNLAIAAMLFCARYVIAEENWNARLLHCCFWSLNIGLMLMVCMDLFPAGILQLVAVLDNGLWYARSQAFIGGSAFQTLTWMRAVGGYLFLLGGVIPLVLFMLSSAFSFKGIQRSFVPKADVVG